MQLVSELEDRLGLRLPATLAFDHPTQDDIASFLQTLMPPTTTSPAPPAPLASASAAAAAPSPQQQRAAVSARVMAAVREVLGLPPSGGAGGSAAVAPDMPLTAAGLNSSAAVELTGSLEAAFGAQLPATLAFDYPSVQVRACGGWVGGGGGVCLC